jgi:N utilization substance protein B
MSRKIARELAFQILFQVDVGKHKWREVLDRTLSAETELPEKTREFLTKLVQGTMEHQNEVDEAIARYAREWTVERMANTDRNILRMAMYELAYISDIPTGATVNEAVELAKRYGDLDSGKFVNGILGELIRDSEKQLVLSQKSHSQEMTEE